MQTDDSEDTGIYGNVEWDSGRDGTGGADAMADLVELANATMPFGKHAGRYLVDLPEGYVLWFKQKGWPEGKLGRQLRAMEEIKANGLESLVRQFIRQ